MNQVQRTTYERRWWILFSISLSILVIVLSSSMINIALPSLQQDLAATMTELQWIANGYMIAFAALMLAMGALGDRIGRARVLAAGVLLFGAANGAAIAVTDVWFLIGCRTAMGIGGAMILPSSLAIITEVFPPHERGRAVGVWAGLNSVGIALGPVVGGALVSSFDWRSIFLVNVPIAAVAFVLVITLVPNNRQMTPKRFDVIGALLGAAWIGGLVFALNQLGEWGLNDWRVVVSLTGAIVVAVAFFAAQRRVPSPLLDSSVLGHAQVRGGVATLAIMSIALVGLTFLLAIFFQLAQGYDALSTGVRLLPLAGGILLGAGSADRAVSRKGTRVVVATGFAGSAIVLLLLGLIDYSSSYWFIGVELGFLGLFLGFIAAPATSTVMNALPKEKSGVGAATNSVARMPAGAIGIAILGSIMSRVYSAAFHSNISGLASLPESVVGAARESLGGAVVVARSLGGSSGKQLLQLARASFMTGWRTLAFASSAVSVAGVFAAVSSLPRTSRIDRA